MRRAAAALSLLALAVACSQSAPGSDAGSSPMEAGAPTPVNASPTTRLSTASPSPPATPKPTETTKPPAMNARAAFRDIVHLADDIGPREATSDNFVEAAKFVQNRFERLGYDVRRERVPVPSGSSWGTPVPRGTSLNVIAEPAGFDAKKPHVVIGAHLDTVSVAPGAEDNASGIAVMLQLAAMVSQQPAALPVQFIAFGAEEPRGSGDALHHFGSRNFVADLSRSDRRAIRAMVSLDRVGVRAGYVPICTATERAHRLRDAMRAAARQADIPTRACTNFTSDHWSFAKAGVPAVRLGSIPYPGYHSRGDVPRVVDRRQLDRVGRTVWAWLQKLN
jgi:acetylornithine deacetylase/succinyl-diaminopimelate desuccinylase-like protein